MRTQIYTADILNLETVTVNEEDETEIRRPTIVPNVEGEPEFNIQTLQSLVEANTATIEPHPDARQIVLVTTDLLGGFASNGLENYFDPIERVSDIQAGNFGAVLGLQVIVNDKTEGPCVAVVDVLDQEDSVTIRTFSAARVKP